MKQLARRAYAGYGDANRHRNPDEILSDGRRDGSFDGGVEAILQRVLSDPKCSTVSESNREPGPGAVYKVAIWILASRLSFFL